MNAYAVLCPHSHNVIDIYIYESFFNLGHNSYYWWDEVCAYLYELLFSENRKFWTHYYKFPLVYFNIFYLKQPIVMDVNWHHLWK